MSRWEPTPERVELRQWQPDPSAFRDGIVTRRSRGAPVGVAISLLLVVVLVWARSRTADQRAQWDAGSPVLVVVSGSSGGEVEVTELGGLRSWTVDRGLVPSSAVGTRIQSRLVGDCRCQLVVREPASIPTSWLLGAGGLVLLGLAQLPQWARWRRVGTVLQMPPQEATVRAVWLRRPVGAPQWAVEVRRRGDPPEAATVHELAGTPSWWFDQSTDTVTVRGPDRSGGVTVLENDHGRAVASSAPRPGVAARSRTCGWSRDLAHLLQMDHRVEQTVEIGGAEHQKVSVHAGGLSGSPPSAVLALDRSERWRLVMAGVSGVMAVGMAMLVVGGRPSVGWLFVPSLASPWILAGARRLRARSIAGRPPLADWADRRAASEAARAAERLGYTTVQLIPGGDTG